MTLLEFPFNKHNAKTHIRLLTELCDGHAYTMLDCVSLGDDPEVPNTHCAQFI